MAMVGRWAGKKMLAEEDVGVGVSDEPKRGFRIAWSL
jgi:hypothetical protein